MLGTATRSLALLVLLTSNLGCSGDETSDGDERVSGASCTSSSDCISGEQCVGPNAPQVCGVAPQEECGVDSDCGMDRFCSTIVDSCSADGIGSQCGDGCTSDAICGPDMACGASGACEAVLCDAGYDCPAHQVCDPTSIDGAQVHARHHGCVGIACSDSEPCPSDLSCVNGVCQDDLGVCAEPMLVP